MLVSFNLICIFHRRLQGIFYRCTYIGPSLNTYVDFLLQTDSDASDNNQDDEDSDAFEPEINSSRAPGYKSLIAIPGGKITGRLKDALKVEPDKVRRLSLSEQALEKATVSYGTDLVR